MGFSSIDQERCDVCGICVEVCPMRIIKIDVEHQLPIPSSSANAYCLNCGHCVAYCPRGAFSLESMSSDGCPEIPHDLTITEEQIGHLLRSRRSTRNFLRKKVDRDVLEKLIDIARYAPSGCNSQPVNWLVFSSDEQVRQLGKLTSEWLRIRRNEMPD